MQKAMRNGVNLAWSVRLMALSCVLLGPSAALAAAPGPTCPADSEQKLTEFSQVTADARAARTRGHAVEGLRLYLQAWPLLPECNKHHRRRLSTLEVLVTALRDDEPSVPSKAERLEQASVLLGNYLKNLVDIYGTGAPKTDGFVVASGLREVVMQERAPFLKEAAELEGPMPIAPRPQHEPPDTGSTPASGGGTPIPEEPRKANQDDGSRERRQLVLGWSLGGVAVSVVGGGLWLAGGLLRNISWSNAACGVEDARIIGNCRERLARAVNIEGAGSALTGGGMGLAVTGLTALATERHRRRAWIAEAGLGAAGVVAGAVGWSLARRDFNAANYGGKMTWTAPEYVSATEKSAAGLVAARAAVGLGGGLLVGAITNLVLAARARPSQDRVAVGVTPGPGLQFLARF